MSVNVCMSVRVCVCEAVCRLINGIAITVVITLQMSCKATDQNIKIIYTQRQAYDVLSKTIESRVSFSGRVSGF